MYNIDFLSQCERFRRDVFRNLDPRNLNPALTYYPPENVKVIECVEDVNGEWVPQRALEEKACSR